MSRACALVVVLALVGCAGSLRDGVFRKDLIAYRVRAPEAPVFQPVSFADNDLAWAAMGSSHLLAVNAVCRGHDDAPLEVLTRHLLFGLTERERLAQALEVVDGREALRSVWRAKLDGVPVELELVVLKKNGCVHDFTYVSPPGGRAVHEAAFAALVAGFAQQERD
jgi:hypothetical protein